MKPCKIWTGRLQADGYGTWGDYLAHRRIWADEHGPIPHGLCVLHRCDNPPCVEIEHLFLGTHADNMADMKAKGRRRGIGTGEQNGRAKLTTEIVRLIRSTDENAKTLARRLGVSFSTIYRARKQETWVGID